ncbi:uncharacterized protein LOC117591204 [Drosophila guanche]|uniref:uncharacterized protein LOC117591204 n=1 Tax=Drosophila guanche TaxID=7266 RepID=UPI00147121B1|nr:uncharacterized protein LOC117591204 [Drosophila guanche]
MQGYIPVYFIDNSAIALPPIHACIYSYSAISYSTSMENENMAFLMEAGVLPRLVDILKQLMNIEPQPVDPLMYLLHQLDCPLIPQAQMKALERKVTRAHDELRYLRDLLIDLGADEELYDSETDEEEYVGCVKGQICDPNDLEEYGYREEEADNENDDDEDTPDGSKAEANSFESQQSQQPRQYMVRAAVAMPPVDQDERAGTCEQPCSRRSICHDSQ